MILAYLTGINESKFRYGNFTEKEKIIVEQSRVRSVIFVHRHDCQKPTSGKSRNVFDEEKNVLGADIEKGYRLACRAKILGNVTVYCEKKNTAVRKKTDVSIPEGVLCVDLGTTGISCVYGYEEINLEDLSLKYMLTIDGVRKARDSAIKKLQKAYPDSKLGIWRYAYKAVMNAQAI